MRGVGFAIRSDLSRFVSETFAFDDSVQAFERFLEGQPTDVKIQIAL